MHSNLASIRPLILAVLAATCLALLATSTPARASIPAPAASSETEAPEIWSDLIEALVEDGFDRAHMNRVFANSMAEYDANAMASKLNSLLRRKRQIAAARKSKRKDTGPEYYEQYLSPVLLAGAYSFMDAHRDTLDKAQQDFGVPGEIQVSILLIETKLGYYVGKTKAFNTLASMAACRDFSLVSKHIKYDALPLKYKKYIKKRNADKAEWAYRELKALLTYAEQAGYDPLDIPGSIFGAIGICQFMPTNALAYGVDGDNDGRVDLFNTHDALHSMSNFLKRHGWRENASLKRQQKVIYRYNHSNTYVHTILEVASRLRLIDQDAMR